MQWAGIAAAQLHEIIQRVASSARRVPLFVWVYLGAILYLYHRMTRDFLGMGTRRKQILGKVTLSLTKEEETLAANIVDPKDLKETFADVGGLESAKRILTEHVVWPFAHPELFPVGSLRSHPNGVLLHGPPGTGKTLLARALAREVQAYFLEVRVETLFTKWVGDSEKLAAAVFSLAHKLGSCVIFIDEIDSLLSSRNDTDSTVYTHAKTIFLTKWDGLVQQSSSSSSSQRSRVLVVGATNRPRSLDEAILRRLPVRVDVPLPDVHARKDILSILLQHEPVATTGDRDRLLTYVAVKTEGFTGSDLKELCKAAVMIPLRSLIVGEKARAKPSTQLQEGGGGMGHGDTMLCSTQGGRGDEGKPQDSVLPTPPPLDVRHFEEALRIVRPTALLPPR